MAIDALPRHTPTADELAVLALLRGCWTAFGALPQLRPDDLNDAAFHLQALAKIVASRAMDDTQAEEQFDSTELPLESFWQTQAPCPRP